MNTSPEKIKVWDLPQRLFHWALVLCFGVAWALAEDFRDVHEIFGYAVLVLVGFRLVWGFMGSPYARFSQFFPTPSRLLPYVGKMLKGCEPRHVGHNPAAAVMIFFLLLMTVCIGVSGWAMTTSWGWGSDVLEEIHVWCVDATLIAVGIHVAAAIYESVKHRENLIKAMFTGFKRSE